MQLQHMNYRKEANFTIMLMGAADTDLIGTWVRKLITNYVFLFG